MAARKNGLFRFALEFFQPAPPRGFGDPALAQRLLDAGRMEQRALWPFLAAFPEGLEETEARERAGDSGANTIARRGAADHPQELWGRARNPLNALAAGPFRAVLFPRRSALGHRHRDHRRSGDHDGLRAGAPLQRRRRASAPMVRTTAKSSDARD